MQDLKGFSSGAEEKSRRAAVKKLVYAAPFVVSLAASPAFASTGSGDAPPPCHGGHGSHTS